MLIWILKGNNFSSTNCENEIFIGPVNCQIQSSSSTNIVCQIGSNSNLQAGTDYLVQVRVKNIGYAIPSSVFKLKFLPIISSSTPEQG